MVVSGLPPLSGFVAKLGLLGALLERPGPAAWTLFALLLLSGLAATIALLRVGVRHFWTAQERAAPRLRVAETLPIAAILAATVALVVEGGSAMAYASATAEMLHDPAQYMRAVLSARPLAQPSLGLVP